MDNIKDDEIDLVDILKKIYKSRKFILIISFSLIFGANEFRPPTENVKHQYIKYLDCINCPIWKEEIYKWRKNNEYEIGIWPYPLKKLKLEIN